MSAGDESVLIWSVCISEDLFIITLNVFFGYFDPVNIYIFNNKNRQLSG